MTSYLEAGDSSLVPSEVLPRARRRASASCASSSRRKRASILLKTTRRPRRDPRGSSANLLAHKDHWLCPRDHPPHRPDPAGGGSSRRRSLFALVDKRQRLRRCPALRAGAGERTGSTCLRRPGQPGVEIAIGPLSAGAPAHGQRLQPAGEPVPRGIRITPSGSWPRSCGSRVRTRRRRAGSGHGAGRRHRLGGRGAHFAIEERASLSPDALTGMEASLRFGGAESCESKIFGRLSARGRTGSSSRPNATGEEAVHLTFSTVKPEHRELRLEKDMSTVDLDSEDSQQRRTCKNDKRLLRALEKWQPNFIDWWREMGPSGLQPGPDLPAHRRGRRQGWLGALRLREDAGLPLGDLPGGAGRRPHDPLRRQHRRSGVATRSPGRCAIACAA